MVENDLKTFLNSKKNNWFSIEKAIIKCGKIKALHNKRLKLLL